jgi:hypothetical protein
MKSKKNRKTIKRIHHKIMNSIKYIKRRSRGKTVRTIKNKKYTHKGGKGGKGSKSIAKKTKEQDKDPLTNPQDAAKDPSKLAQGQGAIKGTKPPGQSAGPSAPAPSGQAQGATPGATPAPGATEARQEEALMNTAMSLKQFTPAGMLGSMHTEKDIKYYFKKGLYALYKVMASLVTLPIRNLNEVIPPELCKQTTDNNFVCSQSLIQYLLTGSKQDYKKILIDSDKKDCIEFEEDGNKIVKCKKTDLQVGGQRGGGGNIVIGCNKNEPPPTFKKNDRVIVLDDTQDSDAAHVVLNDKKWFIGTINRVTDKYIIQIDNGGEITKEFVTSDKIKKYDDDWKDFYKEFYNMPKVVLQDMYDMGHEIGDPVIKRMNEIMTIMYNKSGIYNIVRIFVSLSTKIWQCYSMLLKMDETNVLVVSIKKLIETYKEKKYQANRLLGTNKVFEEKKLNILVTFNCMVMIYDRYLNGTSIEETLKELADKNNRIQVAIGKKLKLIQEKLFKFNLYLRKYECPTNKLESMIHNINNVELLDKMLEALDILLGDNNNYEVMEGDEKEQRIKRIKSCDSNYRTYGYDLTVKPESTYMEFNIDPEKEHPKCKSCSNTWAEVVVRYGCFLSKALHGNKNNMTYILMNIVQDMATINGSNDPIIESIRYILKNIECRSNLREVIINRIKELNPSKKEKE